MHALDVVISVLFRVTAVTVRILKCILVQEISGQTCGGGRGGRTSSNNSISNGSSVNSCGGSNNSGSSIVTNGISTSSSSSISSGVTNAILFINFRTLNIKTTIISCSKGHDGM